MSDEPEIDIKSLLNMDIGAVGDWLIENRFKYSLIAKDRLVELERQIGFWQSHYDLLKESYNGIESKLKDQEKELSTLRNFKSGMEEQYKIIMSEQCAKDEKHCTCVPVLRVQAEKLEKVTRHLISIYMVANEYHDDPEIANEKVNEIFNRLMEK